MIAPYIEQLTLHLTIVPDFSDKSVKSGVRSGFFDLLPLFWNMETFLYCNLGCTKFLCQQTTKKIKILINIKINKKHSILTNKL